MPSSSRRSGPPLHPQPHTRLSAELGADLQRIRSARGLSPADVGQALLLSVRQVEALEGVEVSVFYSLAFFVRGLRKYATLCEVDSARVDAAVAAMMTPGRIATTTTPSGWEGDRAAAATAVRPPTGTSRPAKTETVVTPAAASRRVAGVLLLAVVCAAAGGVYMLRQRGTTNPALSSSPTAASLPTGAPAPTAAPSTALATAPAPIAVAPALEPAAPVVAAPAPEPAAVPSQEPIQPPEFAAPDAAPQPPAAAVAETTPARSPIDQPPVATRSPASEADYGTLRLGRATWLFLRLADNSVTERTLAAGENVSLEARPSYLAIGSPDAVLTLGAQVVDVAPFVRNGQLRMNARDFSQVEPGASPPSPAGNAGAAVQPASAASSSTARGAAGSGASSGSTAPSSSSRPAR